MLVLTCVWIENVFPHSQEVLHGHLKFWGLISPPFFALLWIKSNPTERSMSPWLPNKLKIRYILNEIFYHPQNSKQLLFSFKSLHAILLLLVTTLTFKPLLKKLWVILGSFRIWSDIYVTHKVTHNQVSQGV